MSPTGRDPWDPKSDPKLEDLSDTNVILWDSMGHPSSEGTHRIPNLTPKWEDPTDSRVILWDLMGHPSSEGTHGTPNVTPNWEDQPSSA